jgi:hypothetical protein
MRLRTTLGLLLAAAGTAAAAPTAAAGVAQGLNLPGINVPGAKVPFIEYRAVDAATNGTAVGPNRAFTRLAAEATGRKALHLSAGQYAEFTLLSPADGVDLRYSIPDGPDAALHVSVNGQAAPDLTLTAEYSHFYGNYPFTKNPNDLGEHHYFDDVRTMFGRVLPSGARVRFQAAEDTYLDVADFENVHPAAMPAGYLNLVDFGADPTGMTDSGQAIQNAIDAGRAQQRGVWLPPGTFQVNRQLVVDRVTLAGAGPWYSVLHGRGVGVFGEAAPATSTGVHLSGFAVFGETTVRDDSVIDSGLGGSLGGGSTVDDVWIQHTKAGMWFDGPSDGLTVSRARIQDTTADGVNLHDGVGHTIVQDTFVRNTGDDGMAMWSDRDADHDDAFLRDTVASPQLANGFAIYGGHDDTISNDVASDTVTQGGGVHVSNRFGSVPLSGTTTIAGNLLVRDGDLVPNDPTEIGAMWFDAADSPMNGAIDVHDDTLLDSSYSGIQLVGKPITNVSVRNVRILGARTFAVQLQAPGAARFNGVVAAGLGAGGVYDCGSGFAVARGVGDIGWNSTSCGFPPNDALQIDKAAGVDYGFQALGGSTSQQITLTDPGPDPVTIQRIAAPAGFTATSSCSTLAPGASCTVTATFAPTASQNYSGLLTVDSTSPAGPYVVGLHGVGFDPNGNLALGRTVTATSQAGTWFGPQNLTDGNPDTYWESANGAFPQAATLDLGRPASVDRIVLELPSTWGARTETLSVSADGGLLLPSADYTLDPASGNTVTIAFPATTTQHLMLAFTGNTGWPAAQISEWEVYAH